ncbi:MFS transporter [Chitinispirillales bacterium ANBcel5]|uniref:MFS transporter n=1 Tax=Cellulosispirillum alkaliphilum TaxID=3039283 RepID=UPI002A57BB79|nr:MFS transporter [Chitinispirillales bacterium ANBcel5]
MKNLLYFVFGNKRLLNFGFLFNFFSSFGQTFFISLFVPFWTELFGLTNTSFGGIYTSVTLLSAFMLSVFGRFIDRISLKRFGLIVSCALVSAVAILSRVSTLYTFIPALFLVRWLGQGLMTHTSETGIARHFSFNRGKALSITTLGHPAAQFVLPVIAVPLLQHVGWRSTLLFMSVSAVFFVLPSVMLMKNEPVSKHKSFSSKTQKSSDGKRLLFSPEFWLIAVNTVIIPFFSTALFLYQYVIGELYGWDAQRIAYSFVFYSTFGALTMPLSGYFIDKFSAVKLFPIYLIPLLFSVALLAVTSTDTLLPVVYALLGITTGFRNTMKTALITEVYGVSRLGKIRSYFSTLMVFSTALGPPLLGFFLDRDMSFQLVAGGFFIVLLGVIGASFGLWRGRAVG